MDLEKFLLVLIHKWRIIVPIFAVTFLATLYFTYREPHIYEAKATYVAKLSPTITDNRDFAAVINILSSRMEISTTYAEVADSRRLKSMAGQKLKLSQNALNNISVDSRLIPGTNIIEVVVQGTDPLQVRDFANAIGASTIEYIQGLYETFTLAQLDEAVVPRTPVRPKVALNLFLGGILGLGLGIAIAVVTYFFQTSEKDSGKFPATDVIPKTPSEYELSIIDLRRDLLSVHEQLESTTLALNQIQAALRQTHFYAKEIRSAIYDLDKHFDSNHTDIEKAKLNRAKSK